MADDDVARFPDLPVTGNSVVLRAADVILVGPSFGDRPALAKTLLDEVARFGQDRKNP